MTARKHMDAAAAASKPPVAKRHKPSSIKKIEFPKISTTSKTACAITLTFGEQSENHKGMQLIGNGLAEHGFTVGELQEIKTKFEQHGCVCELVHLDKDVKEHGVAEPAAILVIRNGVDVMLAQSSLPENEEQKQHDSDTSGGEKLDANTDITTAVDAAAATLAMPVLDTAVAVPAPPAHAATATAMFTEQMGLEWDQQAYMYGRVVNKKARHNLCFGTTAQEPDYEQKQGRIIALDSVPLLHAVWKRLPHFFGPKASGMQVEGNKYYDTRQCGIGFHGDAERKTVIAARLGASMALHYQWFQWSKPVGPRIKLQLAGGDMYVMSEKATGFDWKLKKTMTLRHAAGADKFLAVQKQKNAS